ncbi:hypothetical protein TNCV_3718401, partial [Trichonephila clavipes]
MNKIWKTRARLDCPFCCPVSSEEYVDVGQTRMKLRAV